MSDDMPSMSDDTFSQTLAELAVAPWAGRDDISVLLAGLGTGQTLRALLDRPGVVRVDVVEPSPEATLGEGADARVKLHHGELAAFLATPRAPALGLPADGWFVLVLDSDLKLHKDPLSLDSGLRPGGVLTLWTTERDDALQKRMHSSMQQVSRVTVPADEGLRYIYRGRPAPRRAPSAL